MKSPSRPEPTEQEARSVIERVVLGKITQRVNAKLASLGIKPPPASSSPPSDASTNQCSAAPEPVAANSEPAPKPKPAPAPVLTRPEPPRPDATQLFYAHYGVDAIMRTFQQ
jgi:hypothetical protein